MDDQVRELLQRRADDVPPQREVPPSLRSRARRRIAWTALGRVAIVAVVAAGVFAGFRTFGGVRTHQPAGGTHASPTPPTPSSASVAACTSARLRAVGSVQGAAGSRVGAIGITNFSDTTCTLRGRAAITLLDQNLQPITSGITFVPSKPAWAVDRTPKPAGWPVVTLAPGDAASIRFSWSNWCLAGPAPLWRVTIPGGGTVDVINGMDSDQPPPCNGPGLPSTIELGPFEPSTGT